MAKKRTAEPELAIERVEPVTLTPREVMKYGQPTVRLATPKQVARLMAKTISQVRRGELGWREASAIAACARIALSAIASSASDDELNKLGGARVRVRRIIEVQECQEQPSNSALTAPKIGTQSTETGESGRSAQV